MAGNPLTFVSKIPYQNSSVFSLSARNDKCVIIQLSYATIKPYYVHSRKDKTLVLEHWADFVRGRKMIQSTKGSHPSKNTGIL